MAYPLFGPDIQAFIDLQKQYPEVTVSATVDANEACSVLAQAARKNNTRVNVFIDIDNGMHRTGTSPADAFELAKELHKSETLYEKVYSICLKRRVAEHAQRSQRIYAAPSVLKKVTLQVIHHPSESIFKQGDVEIDEQSKSAINHF